MGNACRKPEQRPRGMGGESFRMKNVANHAARVDMHESKKHEHGFSAELVAEFQRAFDHFDEDGSGDLSLDEIMAVLHHQGAEMEREEVKEMVDAIDTDGNGVLDFEEFLYAMSLKKQTTSHLAAMQASVARVVTLHKDVLPLFLPLEQNDPRFEEAERNRKEAVKHVIAEHEEEAKDDALKKTATRAALMQSKKLLRAKSTKKKLKKEASIREKKPQDNKEEEEDEEDGELDVEVCEGANLTPSEALKLRPATVEDCDEVFTYSGFDKHDMRLFSPVAGVLVKGVFQTVCLQLPSDMQNISVMDVAFQPIKALKAVDDGSDDDFTTFYAVFKVPESCVQVFIASKSAIREQVRYEVFCHFETMTFAAFQAKRTSPEDARKALLAAVNVQNHKDAVSWASVVLQRKRDDVEALTHLSNAHLQLGRFRDAAHFAEIVIGLSHKVLDGKDPQRQRAYELLVASNIKRGFHRLAHRNCKAGLVLFPNSDLLTDLLKECEVGVEKAASEVRWVEMDKRALATPAQAAKTVGSLTAFLVEPFDAEIDRVRAIFRWIAENVAYDGDNFRFGTYAKTDIEPESVLHTRRAVCQG